MARKDKDPVDPKKVADDDKLMDKIASGQKGDDSQLSKSLEALRDEVRDDDKK